MAEKKRYAQVGLGGRSGMFTQAVAKDFAETSKMVGLCDTNPGRLALAMGKDWFQDGQGGCTVKGYAAEDFDRMIAETKPDTVIVTTMDSAHDQYICRAMELGCHVITEKPMTIDAERCQRIVDTQAKTGKQVRVTFNYRYAPPRTQVKDLLMSGVIGEVLSVDFHWLLDTYHGADYFRRWHRQKKNSGGLLVHKSTHHFDLVNWWLSDIPESVYATGHKRFATPKTADRLGLTNRGERCHGCPEATKCAFELDLAKNEKLKERYLDNEQHDGYFRDRCIFAPEIEIEDCMNVLVDYRGGAKLCYSLSAFCAWEGYMVSFNGTKGRLEHKCQETVYINGDGTTPGALDKEGTSIKIYPLRDTPYEVEVWKGEGGHGGADPVMLRDILAPDGATDPYLRAADQRAGSYSILCGVAGNLSIAEKRMVRIDDLVTNIGEPEHAPMPTGDEPLPMPLKDFWEKQKEYQKQKEAAAVSAG